MGSGPSSVLSLNTEDPKQDAAELMHIFPNRFVSEHDGSSCILVDAERSRTVLLIPAATSSTATWVCEENEIQAAVGKRDSVVERRILNDTIVVAEIQLPSGGKVVMIPPTLVQTREGRRELMSLLNRPLTDVPSGPESNGETESEKTAQEERMNEDSAASVGPGVSESLPTATLPKFTSLDVQLLRKAGKFDPNFPTNSRNPVEFETDLFKGKVLLLIRPTDPDEDPYWSERLFAKKKRNVVLQIQGKFKRKPKGKLFLGAEISQKMKVGLLTRGLLGLLIRCLERFFSDLRYSFGDTEGLEMPRVAAPAHSSFERVAVTPRGEVPPTISEDPFPESKEASSARRKAKNWDWNMEDTYSMTYYSMYIDLPTWHLVNLPMSGDINLRTLWSDSFLRIVLYEKTGKQQPHLQKYNNYAFAIQVTYFGDKDQSAEEELEDEERDNIFRVSDRSRLLEREESEGSEGENHSAGLKRLDSQSFPALMLADSDGEDFYDAEETSVSLVYEQSASDNDPAVSVDLLVTIDSIVPAWLDVVSNRGGYCRTFAIVVGSNVTFRSVQACESAIGDTGAQQRVSRLVDENFSPRMSTAERMRRMLGLVLVNGDQNNLQHFKREQSDFDATFLKRAPTPLSEKKHSIIRVSGFVARAVSDRHWIEEWAKITDCNISFYHPEKRKPHFRITISSIMRTERMEPNAFPHLPGFCFLVVETVGRSVYLMFSSETDCKAWLEVILRVKMLNQNDDRDSVASQDTSSPQLMEFDNPAEEFLHKSSMWNVKNRRILNCGQFCFRAQVNVKNPLILAEEALRLALNPSSDEDYQRRRQFLSSAAVLKRANVRGLPEESRLAFFLNVYHTMIMHAFLVLGPPGSSLKWIGYFNNIAYEVGDDVFSLTELEHCIIRSKMAYPSQFISRFVLPKSQYAFALTKADYRINFALNCGSTSNPSCIFIFRPERLNEQLDAACRLYLSSVVVTVQKSSREVYVQLPRVCQWFSAHPLLSPAIMVEMSDAPGDCYLGIDNGTQGLSVVLTDANLKRLVTGESSYEFVPDTDAGCYEQLTDDWDLALTDAMKSVHCYLSEHKSLQIKAIGISGQMHGEVLVNHEGQPLSSVRLWCDGRNEDEGEELTLAFQFKVPKRATCARFLWTARNRPELASRVAHVTTPAGWMAYRLTGDFVLGIGDASGIFPIDADTLVYDENMLQTFDNLVGNADIPSIRDILPTVRRAGQDSGVLTQQGAALLGFQLPPDYPIAIAAAEGDQVAALAGSLIGRDGIVSCSFGTSVCANVVSKHGAVELPVEPSVDHFCGADGKNIHMVWLRNGTTFFNTMVASYGILSDKNDAFSAVMPQMLNAAPDCGGLLALPFMDDEPGLQVSRGGTALLLGLNGNNATPGNIAKAALLSTMFNLKLGCKILQENGVVMKELVLTGGLSKSPACGQILANVFGLPTQLLEAADEGSCWGAAVLAKYRHLSIGDNGNDWTLFLESIMKEKRIEQTRFEPDFNAVHEYSKVFNRYQVLVKLQTQLANV